MGHGNTVVRNIVMSLFTYLINNKFLIIIFLFTNSIILIKLSKVFE